MAASGGTGRLLRGTRDLDRLVIPVASSRYQLLVAEAR
jgi:hypothetical protein